MSANTYGFEVMLEGTSCDDARTDVIAALASEGFGVLTEIDVRATFKKKLDVDFRPYTILGVCNPHLAHRALQGDPQIGLLLPCNVVVQQAEHGALVSIASPRAMFSIVRRAELEPIMVDAEARIRRVIDRIKTTDAQPVA